MLNYMDLVDVNEAIRVATQQQEKAVAWLRRRAVPSVHTSPGSRHLYRLPLALASAGHLDDADAVFKSLSASTLSPEGDLKPGLLRDRFTHRWASYPLTVLSAGATALGRLEESRSILAVVAAQFVDRDWGGALGERPEVRVTRRQDLFTTAQMGHAALAAGADSLSGSAVRWLTHLIELQPTPDQTFYVSTDEGSLITSDPDRPDEAGSPLNFTRPRQPVASLGIGAAFLAASAIKFRESHQAQMAEDLYGAYTRLDREKYKPQQSAQVGKRAWGACALYRATRAPSYIDEIVDMVHWFNRGFASDGYWPAPRHLKPGPGIDPVLLDAEITAEFLQHISLVISTLTPLTESNHQE